jgi:hypothetical protein
MLLQKEAFSIGHVLPSIRGKKLIKKGKSTAKTSNKHD